MNFKIDPIFEKYWPPLPDEKFIILEKSILEEGMRENLVVWKEKNILLDGHQRLRILQKHKIPFEKRIDYLSFPDEIHAKHWAHITQSGRRGDAPKFLSICHVLEFEPIYRAEAKERKHEGQIKGGLIRQGKSASGMADTASLDSGRFRAFMARDATTGPDLVQKVLFIRTHDKERFTRLEAEAGKGNDVNTWLEWSMVKSAVDGKKEKVEIDKEAIESLTSYRDVEAATETIIKYKVPLKVQKEAIKFIAAPDNKEVVNKDFIEHAIVSRMPKKRPARKEDESAFVQIENSMKKIADALYLAVGEFNRLQEMRKKPGFGDNIYFRALANASHLQAAYAEWVIASKLMKQRGGSNGKQETESTDLLPA